MGWNGRRRFARAVTAAAGLAACAIVATLACKPEPAPPAPPGAERAFGALLTPAEEVSSTPMALPFGAAADLPRSVDLVAQGALPPIGNQGRCGSCVGWGSAYAAATCAAARTNGWDSVSSPDRQASPAHLFQAAQAVDGVDCCRGAYPKTALELLVKQGCASMQDVPYSQEQAAGTACPANPGGVATPFRIGSYYRIDAADRNTIKSELSQGRAVVFAGLCYTDFTSLQGDAVYRTTAPKDPNGGHCMALVGYNDDLGAYRVQNSWDTDWGDGGYLWMAYEQFEDFASEVWSVVPLEGPGPGPGPEPQPEPTELQGQILDAYQWAEYDAFSGLWWVYLIFEYEFNQPVYIDTVVGTDPNGNTATQSFGNWFTSGYVYFVRTDGYQFMGGTYTLTFHVTTADGTAYEMTGQAYVSGPGLAAAPGRYLAARTARPAAPLPAREMLPGILGANRHPAVVAPPQRDR